MIYLFVDETYPRPDKSLLRFACVAVRQDYYNRHFEQIKAIPSQGSAKTHLDLVLEHVASMDFRTTVSELDLSKALQPLGVARPLDRHGRYSPQNDLWGQAFLYSIAYAVMFASEPWVFNVADVYHDPKTLNIDQRLVYEAFLKEGTTTGQSELNRNRRPSVPAGFQIRRIEEVPKAPTMESANKFQVGIWLADRVLKLRQPQSIDLEGRWLRFKDLTPLGESLAYENKEKYLTYYEGSTPW